MAYARSWIDGEHAAPIRVAAATHEAHTSKPNAQLDAARAAASAGSSVLVLPVVFLHCLLGDASQFRLFEGHLHRALRTVAASRPAGAPRLILDCWLPEARNHGASAHTDAHSLTLLSRDIDSFLRKHKQAMRQPPLLVGHSQGAKAIMAFALTHAQTTEQSCSDASGHSSDVSPSSPSASAAAASASLSPLGLVLFDASPAAYTHVHSEIFSAMHSLRLETVRSKREAEEQLRPMLTSPSDRAFVLSNLVERSAATGAAASSATSSSPVPPPVPPPPSSSFHWRVNLSVLHRDERLIHGWPVPPPPELSLSGLGPVCLTPTLFIGGGLSTRLTRAEYLAALPAYFPNHTLSMIPSAAHFVHQSHGAECAAQVVEFAWRLRGLPDAATP